MILLPLLVYSTVIGIADGAETKVLDQAKLGFAVLYRSGIYWYLQPTFRNVANVSGSAKAEAGRYACISGTVGDAF